MDVSTSVQTVNMFTHIITFSPIRPYFLVNLQIFFVSPFLSFHYHLPTYSERGPVFSTFTTPSSPPLHRMTLVLFLLGWLEQFPLPTHFPSLFSNIPRPLIFLIHSLVSFCFMLVYVMCRIIFRHTYRVECITQIIVCDNIIWPLCLCGKCYYAYVYYVLVFSLSHTQIFPIVAWLFVRGLADTGHKANTPLPHTNKPVTELRAHT